jgi:hypothetical protein
MESIRGQIVAKATTDQPYGSVVVLTPVAAP